MAAQPYNQWTGKDRWKVMAKDAGVNDLGVGDVVEFSLDTSTIKIEIVKCTDTPQHDGYEWKDRDCISITSNKVTGTTTSGRSFEIESSEVTKEGKTHNKLTCRVPGTTGSRSRLGGDPGPWESTSGGVCWTAEDG